jgi:hypothetical protein
VNGPRTVAIDCATQPGKVGLARAERRGNGRPRVTDCLLGSSTALPVEIVLGWLDGAASALLCLDAPLGWPVSLGRALVQHDAGDAVEIPPDLLFHRVTDRDVWERTGKRPLEVGADRIARTAHVALLLLGQLRRGLGEPVPLAWGSPLPARVTSIEVYPAATLVGRGASIRGYKERGGGGGVAREALLPVLRKELDCSGCEDAAVAEPDCFDALVCLMAGRDFLDGRAIPPVHEDVARREGWIWCP